MRRAALIASVVGSLAVGAGGAACRRTVPRPPSAPEAPARAQTVLAWEDVGIHDYTPAPAQRRYDVRHYDLAFTIDPDRCFVTARVTIRGRKERGLRALVLDFYDAYRIDRAVAAGRTLPVRWDGPRKLVVSLPDPAATTFAVTVAYRGSPPKIHSDSGWQCGLRFDTVGGRRVINTCFEPFFARSLFPGKDHPSDKAEDGVDITVTVPKPLRVAATGRRVKVTETATTRTEHWRTRYPIATYLISFAAAAFTEIEGEYETVEGRKLRLHHFVLPEHEAEARRAFAEVPRVLRIYERCFGPYPFVADKFGLVETSYAGLENQTAIASGASYPAKPPARGEYDYTLVHETAHEWAGNAVTCRGWRDIWLHEGLAAYAEGLYLEARDGRDAGRALARAWQSRAGDEALTDRDVNSDADIFDAPTVYNRAPAVLHMLRFCLGDRAFLAGLKAFLSDPALRYGNADTAAFRRTMERAAGRSLEGFFRAWVDGGGFFTCAYDAAAEGDEVAVGVRSVSGGPEPHRLPLVVRLEGGGRHQDRRVVVGPEGTVVRFPRWSRAWRVVFDPESWLLKRAFARRPGLLPEIERR